MKLKESGTEFTLDSTSVDRCSEQITDFLKSLDTDNKEILRIRLSAESILLKWQAHFGEEMKVKLSCFSYMGQPTIQFSLSAEQFDPFTETDGEFGEWSRKLLSGLQTTPVYGYSRGTNTVTFKLIRKKRNPLIMLLAALAAAAVVGAAGLMLLPESACMWFAEKVLTPVCSTYLSVLNFFCIPLIFLSVLLGICGVGDASAFGHIGKKMVKHFLLSLLIITVLAAAAAYPFFRFESGSGSASRGYGGLLDMILGFFPTSLVTPFVDCNAMQLIILGAILGIALLKFYPSGKTLVGALDDLDGILLMISQWFTRLIPYFSFAIIVKSMWSGEISRILLTWKPLLITLCLQTIVLLLTALQICTRHKVKLNILLKKISNTFFIAFGTNSCGASIPEIYSCAANLGVSPNVFIFGIPIGTTIHKPSCAIRLIVISFFAASAYHVGVSAEWFIVAVIMAFFVSIAVPAIPGGVMLFIPMLFSQLGLPAEALATVLAADIFFDAVCTAFCQVSVELALVQQAGKLRLLDEDALSGVSK